jgi:hypothetical protein
MRAALILALALGGCLHNDAPPPPPKKIYITVPTTCVPENLKSEPTYPDSDEALKAAKDGAERYLMVAAGRKLREQRLRELEPVIGACKAP